MSDIKPMTPELMVELAGKGGLSSALTESFAYNPDHPAAPRKPVAWAVANKATGEVGPLGWSDMGTYDCARGLLILDDGYEYVFAYRPNK